MTKEFSFKKYLSEDKFQWIIVTYCLLIFIGFVCSRALVSIGMISLLAVSLLYHGIGESIKKYFHRKELWVLSFFFLIVFVSGFYSEDKNGWLNWVRIKLPYLALPLAFASLRKIEEKKFVLILYGFILIFSISACAVLGNYLLNYESITDSFYRGNGIPMPYSHIRYTLILTFSCFCSWYLLERKLFLFRKSEKWLQIIAFVFLFIALHILSVRSALLALYIGIFFLLFRFILIQKKFLAGGILLVIAIAVPYLAIQFIPSLHNKWGYMHYDLYQFRKGEMTGLSDGVRIISIKGGIEVAKENLWIGVGAGDLKNEMEKFYSNEFPTLPEVDRKLIHNQFVWMLAGTGIIGLIIFLFSFFFPLFHQGNYQHWLIMVLHLILFSSFFTEATLEEQMGTGFYLIFLLLLINRFKKE